MREKVLRCGLFDNLHSTIGILTCSVVGTRKATALYAIHIILIKCYFLKTQFHLLLFQPILWLEEQLIIIMVLSMSPAYLVILQPLFIGNNLALCRYGIFTHPISLNLLDAIILSRYYLLPMALSLLYAVYLIQVVCQDY